MIIVTCSTAPAPTSLGRGREALSMRALARWWAVRSLGSSYPRSIVIVEAIELVRMAVRRMVESTTTEASSPSLRSTFGSRGVVKTAIAMLLL